MYQENGGFDESNSMHGVIFSMNEQPYPQNDVVAAMELQHQLEIQEMLHESKNWHHHHQTPAAALPLLPNFPHESSPVAFLASLGLLGGDGASNGVVHDPLLRLPPQPQPPLFTELLPRGGGVYITNSDGFEFTAAPEIGKNNRDNDGNTKHLASEKQRREVINDKYEALKSLVPCPTKNDKASILGDAINYVKELKMTVAELKGLVEKKRCVRESRKRPKVEEEDDDMDRGSSSTLRSSWLKRKSKNNTEVDVRIVGNEITVKVQVQHKRIDNCLLSVSKVLEEMQLDLHHVGGGLVGDYYSYIFNSKISEGSMIYASAVANKLIQAVDTTPASN